MKKRILVGLSGGVDSAVTAHLLQQQGYDIVGGFMKNYTDEQNPNCHTRQDRDMALKVAQHLGISTFIIFDFRKEYHEKIIQYIYDGYEQGFTPNPDVLCNSEIKFKLFLEEAITLGCDGVATGHYARIHQENNIFQLLAGVDETKDQSYFLSGLNQYQLSKSHFPLGELTKEKVREIAHDIKLPNADRKDSQGLCFIGKVPIKDFLEEALPKKAGNIVDTDGNILGEHDGAHFVTIGQRTGLGLGGGPWYVIKKDTNSNTITVSKQQEKDLMHSTLEASKIHRICKAPEIPLACKAKIRYGQEMQDCKIISIIDDTILVEFNDPQRAISPGQILVLYSGDQVIGNAIIEKARR